MLLVNLSFWRSEDAFVKSWIKRRLLLDSWPGNDDLTTMPKLLLWLSRVQPNPPRDKARSSSRGRGTPDRYVVDLDVDYSELDYGCCRYSVNQLGRVNIELTENDIAEMFDEDGELDTGMLRDAIDEQRYDHGEIIENEDYEYEDYESSDSEFQEYSDTAFDNLAETVREYYENNLREE